MLPKRETPSPVSHCLCFAIISIAYQSNKQAKPTTYSVEKFDSFEVSISFHDLYIRLVDRTTFLSSNDRISYRNFIYLFHFSELEIEFL